MKLPWPWGDWPKPTEDVAQTQLTFNLSVPERAWLAEVAKDQNLSEAEILRRHIRQAHIELTARKK